MSAPHKSLAVKHRPSSFADISGQKILVQSLTNAIMHNKISNAYLLTGIRGVGKTTTARIIAKTINCCAVITKDDNIHPCGQCKSCEAIINSNHTDIIEFDAASHTGIDDIKPILESCEYSPLISKFKVYIIDEIHMLSKSAFNALLKIIEEPPSHIVFIFATTELNKVPLTIISRCQNYRLNRMSIEDIASVLKHIAKKEKIEYEQEAINTIAEYSEGSARDAISLMEQASNLSPGKEKISSNTIRTIAGRPSYIEVLELIEKILLKDTKKAIEIINHINKFTDIILLIEELLSLIATISKILLIKDFSHNYNTQINNIAKLTNITNLSILWNILEKGHREIKTSFNPLIGCEMLVIKAITVQYLPPINELKEAIINRTETPESDPDYIYNILNQLYTKKEYQIYYLLLHQVEITESNPTSMKIKAHDANKRLLEQIKPTLEKVTNKKWQIDLTYTDEELLTLKNKLITEIENTDNWAQLKSCFNSVKIIDILHN